MKNLLLKNMLLVSHREKKARKIEFHPSVTVIKGVNDTGKSSVIKSIPFAFGAEPHKIHPKWKNADIAVLVQFSLNDISYSIYRHRKSFTLFDALDNEIGTYSSVTLELAPALAKLFDFNLKLSDRDGNSVTPPPAYLMLPFYIDQDKGWTETWSSFINLNQFAYWKQRVTGYHFGLRPDKWYEIETKRKKLEADKDEPGRQLKSIKAIRDKANKELSQIDFNINVEQFRNEIHALLSECDSLKSSESKYRDKITSLRTEKIRLIAQIEIVARTHDELSEDYKFACQQNDSSIGCPTCGAQYDNSFSERFEIAQDTETCTDLLASLREELIGVQKEIEAVEQELTQTKSKQSVIDELLTRKQGQIKLSDLINIEGKKSLVANLDQEVEQHRGILNSLSSLSDKLTDEMERLDNPDRRKNIALAYAETLRKYTFQLDVHSLSESVFKDINASIAESGSDLPRAILAYFFTALTAIKENGNSTFFPIVIDAPNQQEQDQGNLKNMLEFISRNRPEGCQLILGLVDDAGIDFGGKVISFEKKYSVLDEEAYENIANEIKYYECINLAIQN